MTQEQANFDRARESIWGAPGFQVRRSTIMSPGWAFIPGATWIVETVRTEDTVGIFLQWIGAEGGERLVIPDRVAKVIHRQYTSIMKTARKRRAQRGAITRKMRQSAADTEGA